MRFCDLTKDGSVVAMNAEAAVDLPGKEVAVEQLLRSDLEPILATHHGGEMFRAVLERITTPEELVRVLGRYIYFNSGFGGGVANLAGEVAVRQDLFRDPDESVWVLADRSVEVASDIFMAAVDEFDDRIAPYLDTHRTLAQATLKGAASHFGFDNASLDRITLPNAELNEAVRNVRDGYGVSQIMSDAALFKGMGFHVGSEVLADQEFNVLDQTLRSSFPALVQSLEEARIEIGANSYPAYFWIRVHTSVEADHFTAAVKGVNTSLRYHAHSDTARNAKGWVMDGFRDFARVQGQFFTSLLAE